MIVLKNKIDETPDGNLAIAYAKASNDLPRILISKQPWGISPKWWQHMPSFAQVVETFELGDNHTIYIVEVSSIEFLEAICSDLLGDDALVALFWLQGGITQQIIETIMDAAAKYDVFEYELPWEIDLIQIYKWSTRDNAQMAYFVRHNDEVMKFLESCSIPIRKNLV